MIKGLRILATILLIITGIVLWFKGALAITAGKGHYSAYATNDEVRSAIKRELGISKLPADLKLSKCMAEELFFDDDEIITIDIYSNYTEEKWLEIIPEKYGESEDYPLKRNYEIIKRRGAVWDDARYILRIKVVAQYTGLDNSIYKNGEYTGNNCGVKIIAFTAGLIFISFLPMYPYEKVFGRFRRRKAVLVENMTEK